jgi:transcriptional regulator with XRE-family HTH domain
VHRTTHETTTGPIQGVRVDGGTDRPSLGLRRARTLESMNPEAELSEFLTSRRARITPQQAGLPSYGTRRRVTGLRREEVAMLAGVSVEYYTRVERGNTRGVSQEVMEGIARALQLDEAERLHLSALAGTVNATGNHQRRPAQQRVRPGVQRLLDTITDAGAIVGNSRLDLLATNPLGAALFAPVLGSPAAPANFVRFTFLDPAAADFFVDWNRAATDGVALLRVAAGQDAYDRNLSDLVGELSTRSDDFRVRWANHNVKIHTSGTKKLNHPTVGQLTLDFESLELPGDRGQTITTYTAEPGSPSQERLHLLASWTVADGANSQRAPEGQRSTA